MPANQEIKTTDGLPTPALSEDSPPVDLVLSYQTGNFVATRLLLLALSPLWFAWSLFCLVGLFTEGGKAGWLVDFNQMAAAAFCYASLLALSFFALRVCSDTRLHLGENGVRLPLRFLLESRGRIKRSWSELVQVDFLEDGNLRTQVSTMTLVFQDGARVPLRLAGLGRAALKNLLLIFSIKAPSVTFRPELSQVDLSLPVGAVSASGLGLHPSYTQLWEEEMASRFGSTSFVPLKPGDKLRDGQIQITGQLGFGGLAAVYLATLQPAGRCVVVKEAVLPLGVEAALKEKAVALFQREAEILSQVRHKRIVSIEDNFQENDRHYLVLSHVDGIDLRRFIKQEGAIKSVVAARWLFDLSSVLVYLHGLERPVLHRDLTPDNVVITSDGELVLIDFGVAASFVGEATGTLVGKQSYIPPEQYRGKACPASDLYALACTIAFCLNGEDPEPLATLGESSLPAGVDAELFQLLREMTEQDWHLRPPSAKVVAARSESICKRLIHGFEAAS